MPNLELGTFLFLNIAPMGLLWFGYRFPDFRMQVGVFTLAAIFFFILSLYFVTEHALVNTNTEIITKQYEALDSTDTIQVLNSTENISFTDTILPSNNVSGFGWMYFGLGLFCVGLPFLIKAWSHKL